MVTISTLWYEYLHEAYQGNYGSDKSISCPTATIIHHFKKFYLREYSKDTKMFSSDFLKKKLKFFLLHPMDGSNSPLVA